ncbi:MAG TPA: hypothetical protein VM925_02925 [Labilithrix sp.]|nr:hypothetical protein [Labilithrix sp.]
MKSRILYLALADARGHLMRAHVLRGVLAPRGVDLDVVTTSREGSAFLASLGTPSSILSEHFRVVFEGCHDMSRDKTDRCVRDYCLDPRRALRDVARLREMARGADLVVDDSLHPALLLAPLLPGNRMRVVHLFGENIWAAAAGNFEGRGAGVMETIYPRALRQMRDAAFACIMHTSKPHEPPPTDRTYVAPPIIAAPSRDAREVRASLALGPGQRLAAVYLNPHFENPRVAAAIEAALGAHGYRMFAVGEGYAGRPGWIASDADLASVVAAADVYISGAGMGALAQSRAFGTPLVALLGNQPEQLDNARDARTTHGAFASVMLGTTNLEAELGQAILRLRSVRGTRSNVRAIHGHWTAIFLDLIDRARKEDRHERLVLFPRPGDEQPARRRSARDHRAGRFDPPAHAPTRADLAACSIEGARRHA